MEELIQPPIGLIPEYIRRSQRINEIVSAIRRYKDHKMMIPSEWLVEYKKLIKEEKDFRKQQQLIK